MDHLLPFVPIDRLHALAQGAAIPDRVQGAALFADISGFTPLTGALAAELGRQRGAEVVLDYLNPIYETLIGALHSYRGSVISFAGDSITCWLEGDDGSLAARCAYEMQAIMATHALVSTPGGKQVSLSIKVGIAQGPARRFLAGDPAVHTFEALAGKTLERMAAAEAVAEKGEVVFSQEVIESLGLQSSVAAWRSGDDPAAGRFAVLARPFTLPVAPHPWPDLAPQALSVTQLRPWVDAPVLERLQGGATYLAELRPVVSVFLKFGGIDYDGDDAAGERLDHFIRWVQSVLNRYAGTMLQLTLGDKGSNLLAVFGAPVVHDDDARRAVAAACELRAPPERLGFITPPQLGLSQGLAWAGAVGGRLRCIYTVMGDEVNMAARLMGKAGAGQALVNQMIVAATGRYFQYRSLGLIQVKGRREPLPVSELVGKASGSPVKLSALFQTPLVGREEVLTAMLGFLEAAREGPGTVLRLEGPAGVGKSHLAAVFMAQAVQSGWQMVQGACSSTEQNTAYLPWRQVFTALLDLADPEPASLARDLTAVLSPVNPAWQSRLPLLGDLLGQPLPETSLTAGLEPRQRREALFALAGEILQAWAARQPLLLVIEDVHWMDEASQALTIALARALTATLARCPAALLVVQRPPLSADQPLLPELEVLEGYHPVILGDLAPEGVALLLHNRLGAPLSPLGCGLIFGRAQGNPFFVEELADALREAKYLVQKDETWDLSPAALEALLDAGCLAKVDGEWQMVENPPLGAARLEIPDTVHAAVLARLDRLPESHKLTLKTASVIGRTFSLDLLHAVHPAGPPPGELAVQIQVAGQRDFVRLEAAGEVPTYIFKHNTTQEVAYGTLLFAQRRELHGRVAGWYEQRYGDRALAEQGLDTPLSPYFPLLAYHWQQAENVEHERVFAGLAGEQARRKYANESAVRYFSRALALTPVDDLAARWNLALGREDVYDVLGDREAQQGDLQLLTELIDQLGDERRRHRLLLRRARYADYTSATDLAFEAIRAAAGLAERWLAVGVAADPLLLSLQAETLHTWGRLLWKRSEYPQALAKLDQALAHAQAAGDRLQEGRCYLDRANVFSEQSNYPAALEQYQHARRIYREVEYQYGEIGCLINLGTIYYDLGNYTEAEAAYDQAIQLARSIGLRYPESYCWSLLGNIAFDLGDYSSAEEKHRRALANAQEIGNRIIQAASLDTLGLVYTFREEFSQAEACTQQAIAIQQAINRTRSLGYSFNHLGLARAGAGDLAGARLAFEQALEIRRSLGQHTLALDDWAGLARLALQAGDLLPARERAETILAAIAEHGIEGCEFPVWVYLTCYQALLAADQVSSARDALQAGLAILEQRAAQIQGETLRLQYLEQVPFNRELRAAALYAFPQPD